MNQCNMEEILEIKKSAPKEYNQEELEMYLSDADF